MHGYLYNSSVPLYRVFQLFFVTLICSTIGIAIGSALPPALFLPLMIVELIMIIAAFAIRKNKTVSKVFLYVFTFISGMTLYPVIAHYVSTIGANLVLSALIVTTFAYGGTALYAWKSKENFSYLGGFLFAGLIALIIMGFVNFFIPFGGILNMVYTLAGIFIFIGYTLYDVNRLKHEGVTEETLPWVVLSLYLDFINLFLYILRLFGILNNKD